MRAGSCAAVAALTTISPGPAACSIRRAAEVAAPPTSGSRCDRPARKRCSEPEWIPIDIRRVTRAPGASIRPSRRSARRMPTADRHARSACCSPSNQTSSASPPNFSRPPPFAYATSSNEANDVLIAAPMCSAPSGPIRERRSESLVKPEMSANSRLPSSDWTRASGASVSWRSTIRGR